MIFKKFSNADVSSAGPVKSSVARGIRGVALLCSGAVHASLPYRILYLAASRLPTTHVLAASLCDNYPYLAESGLIDVLLPKKETMTVAKWCDTQQVHPPGICMYRRPKLFHLAEHSSSSMRAAGYS